MRKRKTSVKERVQYWFDGIMSGGIKSMMGILLMVVVIIVVLSSGIMAGLEAKNWQDGLWQSMLHIIDPGTLGNDENEPFAYMICMTILTFAGLAVFGTLVGIINNAIQEKVEELKKGKAKVLEQNHVVILGFDDEIYKILEELIESNKDYKKGTVVVLDGLHSVEEMRELVEKNISKLYNTKIIYRVGVIYDINAISQCSIDTCKSVIVNVESDRLTIKCILAVSNIIKKIKDGHKPHITAVIKDEENTEAAMCAARGVELKLLNFDDIIAQIIAQSSRYEGVSELFEDLFGFDGSEIYVKAAPEEVDGVNIEDMSLYYTRAIFIGKEIMDSENRNRVVLYPYLQGEDRVVHKDEKLVFIAETEKAIVVEKTNAIQIKEKRENLRYEEKPRNVLILRYSSKIDTVVDELHNINKDIKVFIAVAKEQLPLVQEVVNKRPNYSISVLPQDIFSKKKLKELLEQTQPNSVIVLSNLSSKDVVDAEEYRAISEKEDSEIMLLLLKLRSLVEDEGYEFSITSEIHYSANQKLAQDTGVNDFIVGSSLTNRILAQIAQEKDRYEILNDMITAKGADVLIRRASEYFDLHEPYKLTEIKRLIALSGEKKEVFIGYMRGKNSLYKDADGDCLYANVRLNPQNQDADIFFDEMDALVVIGDCDNG